MGQSETLTCTAETYRMEENLRNIYLFRPLDSSLLQEISMLATEHHYKRGQYIFMEGQTRDTVFFLINGALKIYNVDDSGREIIRNIVSAGQLFPQTGFFDMCPYPGTAEAITQSTIISISGRAFETWLLRNVTILQNVVQIMNGQIQQLQARQQELTLNDSCDRLAAILRYLAQEHGHIQGTNVRIPIPLNQSEIANMVGMTRESVNRVWRQMHAEGIVSTDRGEWILKKDWCDSPMLARDGQQV